MSTNYVRALFSAIVRAVLGQGERALCRAELAELNSVTLPRLYHSIGKALLLAEDIPDELVPYRQKVEALQAGVAAKAPPRRDLVIGVVANLKRFTQRAAEKTAHSVASAGDSMKIHAAYLQAGRMAAKTLGEPVVPQQMWRELQEAIKRKAVLDAELRAPSQSTSRASRLLVLGTVMYASSWFLPVADKLRDGKSGTGFDYFQYYLRWNWLAANVVALSNLVAVVAILFLWRMPKASANALRFTLAAIVMSVVIQALIAPVGLRLGAFLWTGSFIVFAIVAWGRLAAAVGECGSQRWGLRRFAVVCACFGVAMTVVAMPVNRLNKAKQEREIQRLFTKSASAKRDREASATARNQRGGPEESFDMKTVLQSYLGLMAWGAAQQQQQNAVNQRFEGIIDRMERSKMPRAPFGGHQGGFGGGYQQQPRFQQWEGTCSRCGWRTGRQVSQQTQRCPMPSAPSGIPCGGVIVWRSL